VSLAEAATAAIVPAEAATRRSGARGRLRALADDRLVLGGLLLLAAATRLPGLAARGTFDQDQGHDALQLLRLIQGQGLPLLGPPTSIGDFHHGAFYYDLLAPAAAISGANPVVIAAWIALMGVGAVGVTWWLAKSIAGPVAGPLAGAIAGLLLAVSPAAIDESTFIWNPNPIPLFAALALAAAWRGHQTGRARWWVLAITCAGIVFQLHVLGVVFLPPVLALLVADWRAARRRGDADDSRLIRGGIAGLAVVALLFVPLLLHELQYDWSETRHVVAYLTSGASSQGQLSLVPRLVFTLLRIVAWPLARDVTSPAPVAFALAVVLTLGILVTLRAAGERRIALTWLLGTIAWATIALTFVAPSLQTVVQGLPNDHYHAFLDPIVVTIVGVAIGLLATGVIPFARPWPAGHAASPSVPATVRVGGAIVVIVLVAVGVSNWPAAADPNGGWPAAEAAGARIAARTSGGVIWPISVPGFKTPEVMTFPIVRAGGLIGDEGPGYADYWVVVCDRLFQAVVGADCGGPAEDHAVAAIAGQDLMLPPPLVDRFDASARTVVSIYRTAP